MPGRSRPSGRAAGCPGRLKIRLRPTDAGDGCRAPPGGRFRIVRPFWSHEGSDLAASPPAGLQAGRQRWRNRAGGAGVSPPDLRARGCTCRSGSGLRAPAWVDQHSRPGPSRSFQRAQGGRFGGVGEQGFRLGGSTSRPGGTRPPGAGPRGWTCRPVGPMLRNRDPGDRPAGTEGLSLRARGCGARAAVPAGLPPGAEPPRSTSRVGGTQLPGEGQPGSTSRPCRTQPRSAGPRESTTRPGGTWPPGAGQLGVISPLGGTQPTGAG